MSPVIIGNATLYRGDCIESMRTMPDASVHTCVTSPPYFGLRDYGHDGQIGLEQTPDEYVAKLVDVFREVRRVLRDDGTLWLNLGDSYAGYHGNKNAAYCDAPSNKGGYFENQRASTVGLSGLKQKDLIGIPWRVAFALQADGWYLPQDVIWHKPNPMPESVTDRCTKAHEYIFLLSKSPKYYFDAEAIKEPATGRAPGNKTHKYAAAYDASDTEEHRTKAGLLAVGPRETRNRRSVWTVATKPFKGAHFATFPPDLIKPCILAGCPEGGTVLDPFGGAGTTGLVATQAGRNAVLCEINPEYVEMARARIAAASLGARRRIEDAQRDFQENQDLTFWHPAPYHPPTSFNFLTKGADKPMTVKVTFEFDTPAQAAAFLQELEGDTAAAAPKKRGRPPKAAAASAPAVEAPVAAAPAAEAPAPAAEAPAPAAAPAPAPVLVPYDALKKPLTDLADADHETARSILASFGVKKASELRPEQIGPCLEKINEALAKVNTPAAPAGLL